MHGGFDKAVYSYDTEDYSWWNEELRRKLDPGAFGENLTTEGVLDRDICVGDVLKMGTAILQAVQPRLPCYKLSVKFEDDRMTRHFMQAQRWGIYYRVLEEGAVEAGDAIEILSRDPNRVRIADLPRILSGERIDQNLLLRAVAVSTLAAGWKDTILEAAKREGIPE